MEGPAQCDTEPDSLAWFVDVVGTSQHTSPMPAASGVKIFRLTRKDGKFLVRGKKLLPNLEKEEMKEHVSEAKLIIDYLESKGVGKTPYPQITHKRMKASFMQAEAALKEGSSRKRKRSD